MSWIVVCSQPRREYQALTYLSRQSYDTYLPMCEAEGKIIAPLFPRYLFVNLDPKRESWGPIRSTFGVQSVLMNGDKPATIGDKLINRIRAEEVEGRIEIKAPKVDCQFKNGQSVRIKSGPMTGLDAVFVEPSGHNRAVLLLSLFGRQSRVEMKLTDVA